MKHCTKCLQEKSLTEFGKHSKSKDGLRHVCKLCKYEENKRFVIANKDRVRAYKRKWNQENKERVALTTSEWAKTHKPQRSIVLQKRRARLRDNGVKILSSKEITKLYAGPCAYCGANGKMSVDHVVPISRGGQHSIGNLLPACKSCNSSKGTKTITEWKKGK